MCAPSLLSMQAPHLVHCMLHAEVKCVATVRRGVHMMCSFSACAIHLMQANEASNVSIGAGFVPQQGLHCTAHFRSTLASSTWHSGTATRCAISTLLSCPTATWARTLQRCTAVASTHLDAVTHTPKTYSMIAAARSVAVVVSDWTLASTAVESTGH